MPHPEITPGPNPHSEDLLTPKSPIDPTGRGARSVVNGQRSAEELGHRRRRIAEQSSAELRIPSDFQP